MQVTRKFVTSSSPKYLKTRTVSLPYELVQNTEATDKILVVIKTPKTGDIQLTISGETLQRFAEKKTKDGREFYIFHY